MQKARERGFLREEQTVQRPRGGNEVGVLEEQKRQEGWWGAQSERGDAC